MRQLLLTLGLFVSCLTMQAANDYTLFQELQGGQDHHYTANSHIVLIPGFRSEPVNGHETLLDVDSYGVYPPAGGVLGGPQANDDGVVGSLGGTIDVNLLGGAVYVVPIELPSGLGDMKPQLGLCYNSQGKNGLLGWGWDLLGVSSITRTGATAYHDGFVGAIDYQHDRFCLDGQRLMMVSGTTYGGNGSEYRTEQDQMSKIVSYRESGTTGTSYFKVYAANGNILYYGNSSDSKALKSTSGYINVWLLKRIEDRYGNAIVYHYQNEADSYLLDHISYSSNSNGQIPAAFTVAFQYETREDVEAIYVGDLLYRKKHLLTDITLSNGSNEMYTYHLVYQQPAPSNGYPYHLLKEIHFQAGDEHLNPTRIQWGNNNYNNLSSNDLRTNVTTNGITNAFLHAVKFSGDFNGDGFTDVIVTSPDASGYYTTAQVFINKGVSGNLQFDYYRSFNLGPNVHWIHVADFDGDGLDDLLFTNRVRTPALFPDVLTAEIYLSRITVSNLLDFEHYDTPNQNIPSNIEDVLFIGDFLGEGKNSFIIQGSNDGQILERSLLVTYNPDDDLFVTHSFVQHLEGNRLFPGDYNGDGRTEILYKDQDGTTFIVQLNLSDGNYQYEELYHSNAYAWEDAFPGDFNGDGTTDLLFYQSGSITPWNIVLTTKAGSLSQNSYPLPPSFPYSSPGDYLFTLDRPKHTSHYIKVGDFDGNGCADLALFTDGFFNVYYGPLRTSGDEAPFVGSQHISTVAFNLYDNMNVSLGNFLGRSGLTFLGPATVSHLPSMILRHEVKRIQDGLGRLTDFQYDYLMPNPNNPSDDDFYGLVTTGAHTSRGVFSTHLPMRALKSLTTYNVKGKPVQTKCYYEGAMVHKRGKGFLGFSKTRQEDYCNNQLQRKVVRVFDVEPVSDVIYSTMQEETVFDKDDHLMAKSTYDNSTFIHNGNNRVYVPLANKTLEEYDIDHPGTLLKKEIQETTVSTNSSHSYKYNNLITVMGTIKGTTGNPNTMSAGFCDFQEITTYTYAPNDFNAWLVNKPLKTTTTLHKSGDDEDISHQTVVTYHSGKPYQVKSILDIPNDGSHPEDKLVLKTEFQYDLAGNVTLKTVSTPNDSQEPRTELFEYDKTYGRRLLTKYTNAAGHETVYQYHPTYNYCQVKTDCNGRKTSYSQDPLGITIRTIHPDSTVTLQTKRWTDAGYYQWEKKTGRQTKATYYARTGETLETRTYDIHGNEVITEFEYDPWGRITKKSTPHLFEKGASYLHYQYDAHHRVSRITHLDGTYETLDYDGNGKSTTYHSLEGTTQTESKTFNVMGWTTKATDTGGQSVLFEYGPDGKPRSYQVEGHEETRITIGYDARGNRITLQDPNYGLTVCEYNGFGELTRQVSPKADRTDYVYDVLGNPTLQTVTPGNGGEKTTTEWTYGKAPGERGLLLSTVSDNQALYYKYDPLNRLSQTLDCRKSGEYHTSYEYDPASRISAVTYPSEYILRYRYNSEGMTTAVLDQDGETLWKTTDANALGQVTEFKTGNGYVTRHEYDDDTHCLLGIRTTCKGQVVQDYGYSYDDFANLTRRDDYRSAESETFTYDAFNRLTSASDKKSVSSYVYDPLGRMTSKTDRDGVVFANADYAGPRPHAITSAQTQTGVFPAERMDLEYNAFDQVTSIREGNRRINYEYGADHQRISVTEDSNGDIRTKHYIHGCEFIEQTGCDPVVRTFLSGPLGVFAVAETTKAGTTVHYIHKDHLGSWTLVSDSKGKIEQENRFDAWGRCPNADELMFDRGYTGHEHIKGMGLINMNGRLYDPLTSSMLSPDNNLQQPDASQNFNRYAYCLNNPLTYIDPDGNTFIETALMFYMLYCTDLGYEYQKYTGFFALHIDLHLSSQQLGIGVDVSVGMPKSWIVSARTHVGATYYWNYFDNSYSGWELRGGLEIYTDLCFLGYSSTFFHQREVNQVTNAIIVGNYLCNFTYENDYMFHLADELLGRLAADNGDRYRSAAARIRFGIFSIGVNLFTGDPGLSHEDRETFFDPEAGGRETYKVNAKGDDPDKYRAGILYVGAGPLKVGGNSEQIRHFFQNRFAHDFLCGGDSPYFKVLDRPAQCYFYFGTETGNTLW